ISDEQTGAVEEDEVATGVHGVSPLPMGIAREDRSSRASERPTKPLNRPPDVARIGSSQIGQMTALEKGLV
ncbi:hypothetical protein THAOC_21368, partial [Thalassiosira oceanica]